ncbi:MAG: sodium:proton antiporter, partial [Pseudomonadota bacterium]|nr:sodium:proton antiporter [Pseudomonadota bacterium]
ILTWAGLKGGISIALALSLPDMESKPMIVTAAYSVVVFSILIQGLTIEKVINRIHK